MKTIVVATDFSSEANNAMEYAASLAQEIKARLILFNSYQLPEKKSESFFSPAEIDCFLNENREYLGNIAFRVSERHKIKVECRTNLTYVAERLDEVVRSTGADLVVMGMWTNAREDTLYGNTTTFVIQQTSYPVLVVPETLCYRGIHKILFSWDPNRKITAKTLVVLKNLASSFNAQVQVFHVNRELELAGSGPVRHQQKLGEIFNGIEHRYRNLEEDDILEGIERGIREFNADLLVMVPGKPAYDESFFEESRTREMSLRTRVPLLVLPTIK